MDNKKKWLTLIGCLTIFFFLNLSFVIAELLTRLTGAKIYGCYLFPFFLIFAFLLVFFVLVFFSGVCTQLSEKTVHIINEATMSQLRTGTWPVDISKSILKQTVKAKQVLKIFERLNQFVRSNWRVLIIRQHIRELARISDAIHTHLFASHKSELEQLEASGIQADAEELTLERIRQLLTTHPRLLLTAVPESRMGEGAFKVRDKRGEKRSDLERMMLAFNDKVTSTRLVYDRLGFFEENFMSAFGVPGKDSLPEAIDPGDISEIM